MIWVFSKVVRKWQQSGRICRATVGHVSERSCSHDDDPPSTEALTRMRFAVSPLLETVLSLRALLKPI